MTVGVDAEVLVVGAGPAGSTAARALAERGVNVLLVDRESFPRYKTCGGGIIGVTRSSVPAGLPVRQEIYEASFSVNGRGSRTRRSASPIMATVSREEFDSWLLGEAVAEGVNFRPQTMVRAIRWLDDKVEVKVADGSTITARYLLDASGTSSRISREVGVELETLDLGLELEIEAGASNAIWHNRIHLDWGPVPGSYGWLFPKGSQLTVGVIGAKGRPVELRQYLKDLVAQLDLEGSIVLKDSGHLTRCRSTVSPLGSQRVLLAGDAAGLLEPWTREGLSFAVRSGRIAADVLAFVIAHRLPPSALQQIYRDRLEESIIPEMRAGFDALRAFERHPGIFHNLISGTPMGWKYFARITTGDTNLARAMKHSTARLGVGLLNRI